MQVDCLNLKQHDYKLQNYVGLGSIAVSIKVPDKEGSNVLTPALKLSSWLSFPESDGYTSEQVGKYEAWEDNEIDSNTKCPVAFTEIGGRCYFYGYFKLNW